MEIRFRCKMLLLWCSRSSQNIKITDHPPTPADTHTSVPERPSELLNGKERALTFSGDFHPVLKQASTV